MKEMSFNQLFILQANYHRLEQALSELANIVTDQDAVLLLEDAVLAPSSLDAISHAKAIFILSADAHIEHEKNLGNMKIIDYGDWAELLQHCQKVHTWQ